MPFVDVGHAPLAGFSAVDFQDAISRRGFAGVLGAAVVAGLTGCGADDSNVRPSIAATRTVQHPLGSSEIPVAPQRVISMDSSGALQVSLEVGAPLVASETLDGKVSVPGYVPSPGPDFQPMGFNKPNLEQLVKLAPDLIIGNLQRVEELYPKLSAIAPTVPYENAGKGVDWRDSVRLIAELLGQKDKQAAALTAYQQEAAKVAAEHKAVIEGRKVVLLRFTSDELRILRGPIFGSTILDHVGVKRTASTATKGGKDTYYPIDRENVEILADADVILYLLGGGAFNSGPSETFKSYTGNSIWRRLPAVAAGRVAELDAVSWWDGYSVSAARSCLQQLTAVLNKLP